MVADSATEKQQGSVVMWKIVETRRLGITVYVATVSIDGRTYREAPHMSEAGARTWIRERLAELADGGRAA